MDNVYVMNLYVHNIYETLAVIKERMQASDIPYKMLGNRWEFTVPDRVPLAYCKLQFNSKEDAAKFRKQVGKFDFTHFWDGEATYHISTTEMPKRKQAKSKKNGYSGPTGTVLGHGRGCPGL